MEVEYVRNAAVISQNSSGYIVLFHKTGLIASATPKIPDLKL